MCEAFIVELHYFVVMINSDGLFEDVQVTKHLLRMWTPSETQKDVDLTLNGFQITYFRRITKN